MVAVCRRPGASSPPSTASSGPLPRQRRVHPAPPGEEGLRARHARARRAGRRHAVAHGERGMQRLRCVRPVVHQLPEAGRLGGGDAQRVVQAVRLQSHRHPRRCRGTHGAGSGGGMEQPRVPRAQCLAQAQRDLVAGDDSAGRLGAGEAQRRGQREHGRDGDHPWVQHRGAVGIVDLAQVSDGRIGEGRSHRMRGRAAEHAGRARAGRHLHRDAAHRGRGGQVERRQAGGRPVQQRLRQALARGR